MNISSVGSSVNVTAFVESTMTAQTPQQASDRAKLIQAVKTVNESNALGDSSSELTFSVDRATRRTVIRVINRQTQDVLLQIPDEYVLQLAEQAQHNSTV